MGIIRKRNIDLFSTFFDLVFLNMYSQVSFYKLDFWVSYCSKAFVEGEF